MDKLEKYIEKLEKLVELENKALGGIEALREEIDIFLNNNNDTDIEDGE